MTSDSPVAALHHATEVCRQCQECFARAASACSDAHLRKVLGEYSEQRTQFVLQLQSVARQLGEELPAASIQHRTWTDLQGATAGGNDALLAECARTEETAIQTYRAALARDLPEAARTLLESQCRQIEEVRIRLAELRAHLQVQPANP